MRDRSLKTVVRLASLCVVAGPCLPADWPMYGHDPARSATTSESLAFPLSKLWSYEPSQPPRPAWPEPGKELHRMDFDYAFQPVAAGGLLYFGSSADDTVRALNAATGELVWSFTSGGPVRFAPAIARGKAYVGSDDGWLYSLDARTGKPVWTFRAAPEDRQLLGNGRLISRWPLRTGVLVVGNTAYVTAGMWPTQGVYVYALNADTGKVRWLNDGSGSIFINLPHCGSSGFDGVAPQGYLAISGDTLLVPTGRSVPAAFDRHTGRLLYYYPEIATKDGGAWVAAAGSFYFSPANPSWWYSHTHVGEAQPRSGDGMCVYALTNGELRTRLRDKYRVLVAKGRLYAACVDKTVQAFEAQTDSRELRTTPIWTASHSRVYSLALTANALLLGGNDSVTAFDAGNGKPVWQAKVEGQARGMAIAGGRLMVGASTGAIVCFQHVGDVGPTPERVTQAEAQPFVAEAYRKRAAAIVQRSGMSAGYALVVGEPDGRLVEAIAARTKFHVIALVPDAEAAQAERRRLTAAGTYGTRVVVQATGDSSTLSLPSYFASLVVVTGSSCGIPGKELYRVLRPCGGKLVLSNMPRDLAARLLKEARVPAREICADGLMVERGPLLGAGEWRCQWADGGRTGAGAESRVRLPLDLLWFGGPGPDRMMDRSAGGAGSPLSVNGKVFATGEHHVIALDAYTGRELWYREIQQAGRTGTKYTSSNFVADANSLYLAIGSECLRLDQATGETLGTYSVPAALQAESPFPPRFVDEGRHKIGTNQDAPAHMGWGWGYVSVAGKALLGSRRAPKRYAEKIRGYVPWWEPRYSTALFALHKEDGRPLWIHRARRAISGAHVAHGSDRVFLLDATPEPDVYGVTKRRGGEVKIERSLIALSLADGAELWRRDDVPELPRTWTAHLQCAQGVVVVGANVAYDGGTGRELWRQTVAPARPPVIQGNWIIDMRSAYDLRTGKPRLAKDTLTGRECRWRFLRSRGCGNIVGSRHLLFFRAGAHGIFDSDRQAFTTFGGARPNCGVGIIAANGLVIAPETSSGCACSFNYQTSLALVPGEDRGDSWAVFPFLDDTSVSLDIKALRLNLGAPGDRADSQEQRWLGAPQLGIRSRTRVPAPVTAVMENPDWYHQPSHASLVKDTDRPWVYTCGLRGRGTIHIDVVLTGRGVRGIVVPKCERPPKMDGRLDDTCWQHAEPVPFAGNAHLAEPRTTLFIRRDDRALYFAYRREATVRDGKPVPFVGHHTGPDAPCWEDDDFEIIVTNQRRARACHFGVNCSGARFDGFIKRISAEARPNFGWNGEWTSAVKQNRDEWTAEIAIPLETLAKEGIETTGERNLRLNCLSRNVSGHGIAKMFLIDPDLQFYRGRRYLPLIDKPLPKARKRNFAVRLHFIETQPILPGQRVFDVHLQGEPVLRNLDIIREASGRFVPLVKEFTNVAAQDAMTVDLLSRTGVPVINGIEIVEARRRMQPLAPLEPDAHTIALLHLDEADGTVAKDASPSRKDAQLEAPPHRPVWYPHGRIGGCLLFDGRNPDENDDGHGDADGLHWPKGAAHELNSTGFTVELWVRHAHLDGWQFYFVNRSSFYFLAKQNRLYVTVRTPNAKDWLQLFSTPCLQAGLWHHVAFIYDGAFVRIFCDGLEVARTPIQGRMAAGGPTIVGHDSDLRPSQIRGFCGLMDEVRVSSTARTSFPQGAVEPADPMPIRRE